MDRRDRQNLIVAVTAVLLLVAGYWTVTAMARHRALEECLLARGRHCDRAGER